MLITDVAPATAPLIELATPVIPPMVVVIVLGVADRVDANVDNDVVACVTDPVIPPTLLFNSPTAELTDPIVEDAALKAPETDEAIPDIPEVDIPMLFAAPAMLDNPPAKLAAEFKVFAMLPDAAPSKELPNCEL